MGINGVEIRVFGKDFNSMGSFNDGMVNGGSRRGASKRKIQENDTPVSNMVSTRESSECHYPVRS